MYGSASDLASSCSVNYDGGIATLVFNFYYNGSVKFVTEISRVELQCEVNLIVNSTWGHALQPLARLDGYASGELV